MRYLLHGPIFQTALIKRNIGQIFFVYLHQRTYCNNVSACVMLFGDGTNLFSTIYLIQTYHINIGNNIVDALCLFQLFSHSRNYYTRQRYPYISKHTCNHKYGVLYDLNT